MKIFLRRTVRFLLILVSINVLLYCGNRLLIFAFNPFQFEKNVNILVLGDSHTKYAVNAKRLKNVSNLSQSADSYFYSFQKLKYALKANPQIDTVLLSFSQHNIHKCIETRWLLNNGHIKERMRLYLPLLGYEDYFLLLKKEPLHATTGTFNQVFFPLYILTKKDSYGGYEDLERDILKEEIARFKKEGREEFDYFIQSELEKSYLKKIQSFCKKEKVTLILVNSPLHETLQNKQQPLYSFYKENFSELPFYDFSKLPMKDSHFGDLAHLNPKGAEYFLDILGKDQVLNFKSDQVQDFLFEK